MNEEQKLNHINDLFQIDIHQTPDDNVNQYIGLVEIYIYMLKQYHDLSMSELKTAFEQLSWRTYIVIFNILFFFDTTTHERLAIAIADKPQSYKDIYDLSMENYNKLKSQFESLTFDELLATDFGQDILNRCIEIIQLLEPIIDNELFDDYFDSL